jgi:virulence factor Mce-like protein
MTFGGSVPLRPEGYRVKVPFEEATRLAEQADVRISGVRVGKVTGKALDRGRGVTNAELEIESRYAPLPSDTRAVLRQKTLLGETYVELSPGDRAGEELPEGASLPKAQVASTVELDEIFRTFDEPTRRAFSSWLDEQGRALDGRGRELSNALGSLTPFAENTDEVLRVLRDQSVSTTELVRDTGAVLEALSERRGQLRGLVGSSERVFRTTARRDRQLARTVQMLPGFLDELRATATRTTRFAKATDPLVTQLRPAAKELSPTLVDLGEAAPDLRDFLRTVPPLERASRRGLPALERVLDDTRPLLGAVDPFLRSANPILQYAGLYRREIASFFALDVASTQATDVPPGIGRPVHYLRTTNPVNPEVLSGYGSRLASNRSNPYVEPGGLENLAGGLKTFDSALCGRATVPGLGAAITGELRGLIEKFVYGGAQPATVPRPRCQVQRPLGQIVGQPRLFPRLEPLAAR